MPARFAASVTAVHLLESGTDVRTIQLLLGHPQQHLSKFTGILQADGYAGFNQIYESGRVQEAACWAHVRRKFYDLKEAHKSPIATEAVERIAALYGIEEEIRGRSPDERRAVRNARSRPLLAAAIIQTLQSFAPVTPTDSVGPIWKVESEAFCDRR